MMSSGVGNVEPAAGTDRRESILEAVGFAAERFLRGSWEQELPAVLARLGEATGSSRSYLFRNVTQNGVGLSQDMIGEWCAPGITVTFEDPENHDLPYAPRWNHYVEQLGAGKVMSQIRSEVSGIDAQDMDDEEILSTIFLPVNSGEEWWGYMGFDDCVHERRWSPAEVDVLRAAAGILGAAIRRQEVDAARESAEQRYRAMIEQIPAVTYIDAFDPEETPYPTLFVSPQIEGMLGYEPREFVEDPHMWDRVAHPDDLELMIDSEAAAGRTLSDYEAEYRLIAKDGRTVWVHDEAKLLDDDIGGRKIWHGVLHDITGMREALEREQEASAQLRALDEMKDVFLNAVSHDLRTPAAAILGLALTLARDEGGLEEQEKRDFADRIAFNARKLNRLVNDLLDLDRLTQGVIEIQRSPTEVERLVARVIEETDVSATHPVKLDLQPTFVSVDTVKVERIVENLVLNAERHTPEGTAIHIHVRPEGGAALIVVEDEGPGVAEELKESVFDAFTQGELGHSPGVGIGLSLVARFAELHGGRAWVEEREGGGASFRVLLPGAE
jgi:PAS domain S-box-containing protein